MSADLDWLARGACTDENPDVMFPDPHDQAGIEEAKRICGRCHVEDMCRSWARDTKQSHGVWGGEDQDERERKISNAKRRESRRRARLRVSEGAAA